jgi:DNA-binding response OmpR family regulator
MRWSLRMNIVLITDEVDSESVLPGLPLQFRAVRTAPLGQAASVEAETAHVAIVDALTDLSRAREVCQRLAATQRSVAVVAVVYDAGLVEVDLEWGIDDVVLPDAGPAELQARLPLAVSRRRGVDNEPEVDIVNLGDLTIDHASHTATVRDRRLDLTPTEFNLLNHLAAHQGRVFTRTQLLRDVWGYDSNYHPRTVDVHVQRLRSKLGAESESLIDTVRGVGYMASQPQRRRSTRRKRPVSGTQPVGAAIRTSSRSSANFSNSVAG